MGHIATKGGSRPHALSRHDVRDRGRNILLDRPLIRAVKGRAQLHGGLSARARQRTPLVALLRSRVERQATLDDVGNGVDATDHEFERFFRQFMSRGARLLEKSIDALHGVDHAQASAQDALLIFGVHR